VNQRLSSTQTEPALDEEAFQQLLAAAYALQGWTNRLRLKNVQFHCERNAQKPDDHRKTIFAEIQDVLAKEKKSRASYVTMAEETETQAKQSNPADADTCHDQTTPQKPSMASKLFWEWASVVGAALILTLLLSTSVRRYLPLHGFSPPQAGQKPTPFGKTIAVPSVGPSFRPMDGGAELPADTEVLTRKMPITAYPALAHAMRVTSLQKSNVKPHRLHTGDSIETDIVAKDIVIHHGTASAQALQKP